MHELSHVNSQQVGQSVMQMLHTIQKKNKGIQVASVALAFRCLIEEFDVSLGDAMTITNNLEQRAKAEKNPEILTVRDFIRNELR